jgi:hypothetical protein
VANTALACADADEFVDASKPTFEPSVAASDCADAGSLVVVFATPAATAAGSCEAEAEAEAALAKVAAKRCGALPPPEAGTVAVSVAAPGSDVWRSAVTLRATVAAAIEGESGADASRAGAADFSSAAVAESAAFASPKPTSPAAEPVATNGSISSPLNSALTGTG